MDLRKEIGYINSLAENLPMQTPSGKVVKEAAAALAAKMQVLLTEIESPTPITAAQAMQAVVSPYIKTTPEGFKSLDGKIFRGDIPPSVVTDFYNKITQGGALEKEATTPALESADKKKAPPLAAEANTEDLDERLSEYDEDAVALVAKADNYMRTATSAASVEKAKSVVSNAALIAMARAAGLVADNEINLADANGWGILTRKELAKRVFNYYHPEKA